MKDTINISKSNSAFKSICTAYKSCSIDSLIYVGAGDGTNAVRDIVNHKISKTLLIEANPSFESKLLKNTQALSDCYVITRLISDVDGVSNFYISSNPLESCLLDIDNLKSIWPNSSTTSIVKVTQERLDSILETPLFIFFGESVDWLTVDCFPSLNILQGAEKTIRLCTGIQVRVVLDKNISALSDSYIDNIISYLHKYSFKCVSVLEGLHPAVGEALFVKDWPAQFKSKERDIHEVFNKKEILIEKQERIIQSLTQMQDEQEHLAGDKQAEIESLILERDKQGKLAEEKRAEIENLVLERNEQDRLMEEKDVQIQKTNIVMEEKNKQLIKLQDQIEKLRMEITSKDKRITQLEDEQNELDCRQKLLDTEMIRAEAQIELIKDVVLREEEI